MNGLLGVNPFGAQSAEVHIGIVSELSPEQMQMAAAMDIRYWLMLYPLCPHCGVEFAKLHPFANLVPHWNGQCVPVNTERQKDTAAGNAAE